MTHITPCFKGRQTNMNREKLERKKFLAVGEVHSSLLQALSILRRAPRYTTSRRKEAFLACLSFFFSFFLSFFVCVCVCVCLCGCVWGCLFFFFFFFATVCKSTYRKYAERRVWGKYYPHRKWSTLRDHLAHKVYPL